MYFKTHLPPKDLIAVINNSNPYMDFELNGVIEDLQKLLSFASYRMFEDNALLAVSGTVISIEEGVGLAHVEFMTAAGKHLVFTAGDLIGSEFLSAVKPKDDVVVHLKLTETGNGVYRLDLNDYQILESEDEED